ncbi:DMT family transporter [Actinomadura sp. NAK00032]|uniref:DMT family transporter n=1 Tax=Actinomadura sp. NAK00032 TaxID=2742128 RepID=UPI00159026D1|nr:DMT family transporter [Actinomadura sp. NAK00032]QKW34266.1 DMT family transporter [Actinomadura sp. NAK00032]
MIAIVLALLAGASNALASVLQRRVAKAAPESDAFKFALILDLLRSPMWLGGIGALIAAFVLQAAALSIAGLSLVQPLLAVELPFTMILIAWLPPRGLTRVPWTAVVLLSLGLAVLLFALSPDESYHLPSGAAWIIATTGTVACVAGLIALAWLIRGPVRAVLLGITTSIGFALTAAFMNTATHDFERGLRAVLTSWQLYAMALAGLASLFLLQNALQSGTLVAVQPALTISDPVASIILGVYLFGENVRGGPWVLLEAVGMGLLLLGSIGIARSPLLHEEHDVSRAPSR